MVEKREVCEGHLAERCGWCKNCKSDILNFHCPFYKPIVIYIVDVIPRDYRSELQAQYSDLEVGNVRTSSELSERTP